MIRIALLSVGLIVTGCSQLNFASSNNELTVLGGEQLTYQCEDKTRVIVKYYSLSDSSLGFVKLGLKNELEITLARTFSASGERYSNEAVEWSVKGSRAFVQIRNQDKKWEFMHRDCQLIEGER